nr:zinc finger protein MAGPIE-like [Ipomoea batatas]
MTEEEGISSICSLAENPIPESNPPVKKKRNLPGNPDPEAEVIALSPKTLMATNRYLCEICGKGFQRDQNLQLHRRGHNLPWKLKQRSSKEVRKRVYVCQEKSCVHHHPSRALGDLTGIKKHFCRKHGEKKWKCDKCAKRYAVQSDWKAHSKTCGTREYRCDCGTIFSRRDSFLTHRAFCDALAEETARVTAAAVASDMHHAAVLGNISYHFLGTPSLGPPASHFSSIFKPPPSSDGEGNTPMRHGGLPPWMGQAQNSPPVTYTDWDNLIPNKVSENAEEILNNTKGVSVPSLFSSQLQPHQPPSTAADMSATALLQKAAQIGATATDPSFLGILGSKPNNNINLAQDHRGDPPSGLGVKWMISQACAISRCTLPSVDTYRVRRAQEEDKLGISWGLGYSPSATLHHSMDGYDMFMHLLHCNCLPIAQCRLVDFPRGSIPNHMRLVQAIKNLEFTEPKLMERGPLR